MAMLQSNAVIAFLTLTRIPEITEFSTIGKRLLQMCARLAR